MYTFTDTLYDRRRRGPARKPVLRLCSSRRLVTFKAAKHAAMQLPCNIVLPPWKRPTSLLLSRVFHGLQTLSPPISRRALSLHSGLSCFPTLNWIECRIRPFGIGPLFLLRIEIGIEIEREERNHFARMNISTPCISTRSAGNAGFRHNSDAPRKLHREHGASVCFAKIPLDGMNP